MVNFIRITVMIDRVGRLVSQLLPYRLSLFYVLDGSKLCMILSNKLQSSRILTSKCSKHLRFV